jgi:hypothetical protein
MTMSKAGIYIKNTDLDKATYDQRKAEDEQLIAYYRNYMTDDKLSEEERKMYQEKVEKLTAAQNERLNKEGDFMDTSKIAAMLDHMVQIDSDPTSEKAKAYYKQLAETEKANRN